jgi:hypothetical protein
VNSTLYGSLQGSLAKSEWGIYLLTVLIDPDIRVRYVSDRPGAQINLRMAEVSTLGRLGPRMPAILSTPPSHL